MHILYLNVCPFATTDDAIISENVCWKRQAKYKCWLLDSECAIRRIQNLFSVDFPFCGLQWMNEWSGAHSLWLKTCSNKLKFDSFLRSTDFFNWVIGLKSIWFCLTFWRAIRLIQNECKATNFNAYIGHNEGSASCRCKCNVNINSVSIFSAF